MSVETSKQSAAARAHYELAMRVARFITSGGSSDPDLANTQGDEIKRIFGFDLGSDVIKTALSEHREPESIRFHAGFAGVDNNAFINKMRGGQTLSRLEMSYAVATFDNNFRGLFGDGTGDVKQDHPMYFDKFSHLYINGRSVADLCSEQTQGMGPFAKSDYMKCYFMAEVLASQSAITVSVPSLHNDTGRVVLPLVSEIDRSLTPRASIARYNGMVAEAFIENPGDISSYKASIDKNMGAALGGPNSKLQTDLTAAMTGIGAALSMPVTFTAGNLYAERARVDAAYQEALRACHAAVREIEAYRTAEIESKRPSTPKPMTALDPGYIEAIRGKASRNENLTKEESEIFKIVSKYEEDM